ncbi:MAG: methyltransferase domain-containing protein [Chloroflexi bacterium]|nr:methyltransferase domain-containing protein [Chloroflexota bacterium]
MLTNQQDAFGHGVYDYFRGRIDTAEIIEKDDRYIDTSGGPKAYFSEYKGWVPSERKAMRYARGRALDIGSGAGRCSLYLQEKGLEVTAIDNSPLAIEVCKLRGVKDARIIPISQISSRMGIFDTVLMMGNNFGLFGSFEGAKRLLKKLDKITSKNGRIITSSRDVYRTENPEHLAYQESNRRKGRMSGQIRIRVRYKQYIGPWFDYLMVSKKEMENILDGTGWQVGRYIDHNDSQYIAIIDKVRK